MSRPIDVGIVGSGFAAEFHYTAYLSAERRGIEVEIPLDSAI